MFEIKNNVGISQLKYQKNMFNSAPDMVCFAAIHSKFDNSQQTVTPKVSCFMFLISNQHVMHSYFIFLNFQAYFLLRNCQHTCLQKLFLKSKNSCKEYFVEQKQIKSTTAATPNFECLVAKHVMFAPNHNRTFFLTCTRLDATNSRIYIPCMWKQK